MIKFFRSFRQKLLNENKVSNYLLYAVGEIFLVVIGILIALQINNWNENRKNAIQERAILQSLQFDLRADVEQINIDLDLKKSMIEEYTFCLDLLSEKKDGTKKDLMENLKSILQVGGISLNETTFNNLQTTGEIRLIRNKSLADSIVSYYNLNYLGWATALRDYTRNITAPYFMGFDYLPQNKSKITRDDLITMPGEPEDFKRPPKTLEDYKNDYFIINTLRQKIYNIEGVMFNYQYMLTYARNLDTSIQNYLYPHD